jgi:hypothetical protein
MNLSSPDETEKTFRDTCRSYIEKTLSKATRVVGLPSLPTLNEYGEVGSYCAIKAWEIEHEMFERFQGELGLSRVAEEYRSKARSLRTSLEDRNNIGLCLRVLVGEIPAAKLVSMSPEQLASQKAKLDRAKAEQAAKSSALLTPEASAQAGDVKKQGEASKSTPSPLTSVLKSSKTLIKKEGEASQVSSSGLTSVLKSGNRAAAVPSPESANNDEIESTRRVAQKSDSFQSMTSENKVSSLQAGEDQEVSPATLKALMKASAKMSRPPPPPSLATSFQNSAQSETSGAQEAKDRGARVTSSSGGDRFRIEIMNPRSAFDAALYLEDESFAGVNGFLEDGLTEKGRLRIEEFSRFLSDKLSGRRWIAIPLRLTTLSEQDGKEYRKFYKDYEVKKRIAMFSVGMNSKVFLVTPKFHGAATGLVPLPNKSSTYAIVLTKEVDVLMD